MRPPLLIWRLLLVEVWRLLLISAAALVAVAAFTASVRPLAAGELAPLLALKFMALAVPPMLQFVLPFAAGFAATLAHHRFASENEALAASVGGISHLALLAPAALTGLALAGALVRLTNHEIPHYFRRMEALVSRDAAGVIAAAIERGDSFEIEGMLVHADAVHRLGPDGSGSDRLVLDGVVAMQQDAEGEVEVDVAAEHAEVWLRSAQVNGDEATVVTMRLRGPVGWRRDEGMVGMIATDLRPIVLPHSMVTRTKFLSLSELERLSARPDLAPQIDRRRRRLAAALAEEEAVGRVRGALEGQGRLTLIDEGDRRIDIRAAGMRLEDGRWRLAPPAGQPTIEVTWRDAGDVVRRHRGERAWLRLDVDESAGRTTVKVDVEDVATVDAEDARRAHLGFSALGLADDPAPSLFEKDSAELLSSADASAAAGADSAGATGRARNDLRARITGLRREIIGNRHERWALSVSCLVMTLLGAVMALRLRDSLPLGVYLWSFFPAVAAVMTIAGGESVARANLPVGLVVLWGGVAALSAYGLVAYRSLCRH